MARRRSSEGRPLTRRIAAPLGVVGVGVVLGAGVSGAAPQESMTLSGAVEESCTLTVTASGAYDSLDLRGPMIAVPVGTSVENCNAGKGYVVTVATRYGTFTGALKGVHYGQMLPYIVNYGSLPLFFFQSTALATYSTGPGLTTVTVGVSYGSAASLANDTYTDTLTFTLSTK
jgi:hypothetical protein